MLPVTVVPRTTECSSVPRTGTGATSTQQDTIDLLVRIVFQVPPTDVAVLCLPFHRPRKQPSQLHRQPRQPPHVPVSTQMQTTKLSHSLGRNSQLCSASVL